MRRNNNRNRYPVNHFIMIPLEEESFIESYKNFCEYLKQNNPQGYDKRLLQKPLKLHFSVVILNLNEEQSKIDKVKNILKSIQPKLKNISQSRIEFEFEKFNFLGNNINNSRVVYAEMKKNESFELLNQVINEIIKELIKENIIDENELSKYNITKENGVYSILLHLTLMNITFFNKVTKQKERSFDASDILSQITNATLEKCKINKINFCVMRENKATEKYELIESYDI